MINSVTKTFRMMAVALLTLALALGASGCGSQGSTSTDTPTIGASTVILDVRTPGEYAAGHLEGSQLLDFNSGEFTAAIPTLDKDLEYLIYCRSGNRAGQAMRQLQEAGFTKVSNLGSLEQAAKVTGVAIVK